MAKKEDTGFLYIREKEQKAGLVFGPNKDKYIGLAKDKMYDAINYIEDVRSKLRGIHGWAIDRANKSPLRSRRRRSCNR